MTGILECQEFAPLVRRPSCAMIALGRKLKLKAPHGNDSPNSRIRVPPGSLRPVQCLRCPTRDLHGRAPKATINDRAARASGSPGIALARISRGRPGPRNACGSGSRAAPERRVACVLARHHAARRARAHHVCRRRLGIVASRIEGLGWTAHASLDLAVPFGRVFKLTPQAGYSFGSVGKSFSQATVFRRGRAVVRSTSFSDPIRGSWLSLQLSAAF